MSIIVIEGPQNGLIEEINDYLYLNEWEIALWDTEGSRYLALLQKRYVSQITRELQRIAVEDGFNEWDAAIPPDPPQAVFFDELTQVDPGPIDVTEEFIQAGQLIDPDGPDQPF